MQGFAVSVKKTRCPVVNALGEHDERTRKQQRQRRGSGTTRNRKNGAGANGVVGAEKIDIFAELTRVLEEEAESLRNCEVEKCVVVFVEFAAFLERAREGKNCSSSQRENSRGHGYGRKGSRCSTTRILLVVYLQSVNLILVQFTYAYCTRYLQFLCAQQSRSVLATVGFYALA